MLLPPSGFSEPGVLVVRWPRHQLAAGAGCCAAARADSAGTSQRGTLQGTAAGRWQQHTYCNNWGLFVLDIPTSSFELAGTVSGWCEWHAVCLSPPHASVLLLTQASLAVQLTCLTPAGCVFMPLPPSCSTYSYHQCAYAPQKIEYCALVTPTTPHCMLLLIAAGA
jgi:hypothetical protein